MRIAFIHPDLGIGGAERLVVDAALGLQNLGHTVHIYTSHHDPSHCFEETRDGTLTVHAIHPPIPRAINGKFHILLAHLRQLHLTSHILFKEYQYDVFFVDQLSTYKLLANGELIEEKSEGADEVRFTMKKKGGLLKKAYRLPMDWLEEITTRQADCILANSRFTSRVFKSYFPSIPQQPIVVYPGINIKAYEASMADVDMSDSEVTAITSDRPTLLSLNRFEKKKNAALAISAFALLRSRNHTQLQNMRLVLGGGYDPRLEDNDTTLSSLVHLASTTHGMTYALLGSKAPSSLTSKSSPPQSSDVIFLLNFSTAQRTALLRSPSTLCLLYTPANEHFGIGPVEGLICGLPVLSSDSGGPVETLADGVGWLRPQDAQVWADALEEIIVQGKGKEAGERGKKRAREVFGMDVMAGTMERELIRVVGMGKVDSWWDWEWIRLVLGLIFGLLIAWVPIKIGDVELSHRVVLAPLTRFRANDDHVPIMPLVKEYYSQRASEPGTLLITEGVIVHPRAGGFANAPGIWSDAQVEAWKEIVSAIHEKGSYVFLQIATLGRGADPAQLRSEDESYAYVSASDLPILGSGHAESPRPLTVEEIREYMEYYAEAAKNAVHKAGFDGVEVHGANGFLIEQFLKESSNRRTDSYGGSPENQARFALEVIDAIVDAVGPRKTALRLSPWNTFQDTGVKDPIPTYSYLVKELKKAHPTLAYIHVVEPRIDGANDVDPEDVGDRSNNFIREIWTQGPGGNERRLISAGNHDLATGVELADTKGDLVAYGRRFISNPDLPYRLKHDIPLTPYDRDTFYVPGSHDPRGYTDYAFAPRDCTVQVTPHL
ncbi:Alpha-1,3-mannosyltransferase-like protein [Marasmius crinis-equi]|uniref:Asparagine-linked glycosylation protein 2 n=1 Tax=Marasmius crinis-equi TaxID=585013 RepID=A0ABR3EXJ0_9AGAR